MGRSRRTHAGRALTEKQDRFVRLIAHGVSNREACRLDLISNMLGNPSAAPPLAPGNFRLRQTRHTR